MRNEAERKVSTFYNTIGWEHEQGVSEDARRWEDLRLHAQDYVRRCRLRVLQHIPQTGENLLDMASGPIQYREYLAYSKNFKRRYCVDLSRTALEQAEQKIGEHGVYLNGNFLDLPLEENSFDCSISLHTIYHIDKDEQERAVRKLLHVTKPDKPVIIVYSNPRTLARYVKKRLKKIRRLLRTKEHTPTSNTQALYFYAHPLTWWARFNDNADIRIVPWRSFRAMEQEFLFPERFGEKMFALLFQMEEKFPHFFAHHFQYPMIILKKRK